MLSQKNQMLMAATSLGLGDQLQGQVEDEVNKRKKVKKPDQADQFGPGTMALYGGADGFGMAP